jgi:hypothetical protein
VPDFLSRRHHEKLHYPSLRVASVRAVDPAVADLPYPTEPGIQLYLDQLKAKNPKAARAKPSDFTDISILKELESSGFIDRLYK